MHFGHSSVRDGGSEMPLGRLVEKTEVTMAPDAPPVTKSIIKDAIDSLKHGETLMFKYAGDGYVLSYALKREHHDRLVFTEIQGAEGPVARYVTRIAYTYDRIRGKMMNFEVVNNTTTRTFDISLESHDFFLDLYENDVNNGKLVLKRHLIYRGRSAE